MSDLDISKDDIRHYLWKRGDLNWKLDSLQKKIRHTINSSNCDKILILSSRQIGKSYLSTILAIEFCLRNPNTIVRILAPTLKQVQDIVTDNLNPICLDAPEELVARSKSEYRWRIGHSSLRLGSLERAHVDNSRGGNASLVILEEGGFVHSEDYRYAIDSVLSPQLLRSGGKELHISSPSEDSEHVLHTEILPYCELKNTAFQYSVYDSPSISPEQIEKAIERCGGKDTEAFQREYMARVIRSKTLMVVPEFNPESHVRISAVPEYYNAVLSIDMGGIRDKTAGYICIWDFLRGKMIIQEELFLDTNSPTSLVVEESRKIMENYQINGNVYADVPGQVQIDMAMSHNFPIAPPIKDDKEAGLNNLRLMFLRNRIEINPRCKQLIGSLKSCRYNDKRTDFLRSDLWGHADAIMALSYGCRMIDMVTNPYPKPVIDRDHQIQVPYRDNEHADLEQLALELNPWNPMRSRKI